MSFGGRKMTPKGQMSGNGSGPAIMLMPDHIRATFMPDPPLNHLPPPKRKRIKTYTDDGKLKKGGMTGVAAYMAQFERGPPPKRIIQPTPLAKKEAKKQLNQERWKNEHDGLIEEYRKQQKDSGGEFMGMNCYNTLFVGRLAYEVSERKLLREFEAFGPVKDLKLIAVKKGDEDTGKSRGYAFIEYENEEDMKKAYRAADGIRLEGRDIVVDVERGHTVPNWLPRRFGGGLGGTRIGGKDINVTRPGRYDPSKPGPSSVVSPYPMGGPPMDGPPPGYHPSSGYNGPPPSQIREPMYGRDGGRGGYGGPPPRDRYGGPPPPGYYDDRGPPPPGYYGNGPPRGGGYGRDRRDGYNDDRDRGMKRGRDRDYDRDRGGSRRRY
jgi:U1 small nuclear ribonucleoprotein 70kDa